jgi:hypothetical protein
MREIPIIIIIISITLMIVGSIGLAIFTKKPMLPPHAERAEGFRASGPIQAELPAATQSSFIPQDSAAATTANPELAKPTITDFVDSRDSFKYFLDIYSPEAAAGAGVGSKAISEMLMKAPRALQKIEEFILRPETIPSAEVIEEAAEARRLADKIRRVGPMDPVDVGWERPGCISYRNDNLLSM